MRKKLFGRLMTKLERKHSKRFERIVLKTLMKHTASCFRVPAVRLRRKALRDYAVFTEKCMETGDADPDRLYERSYALGKRIRRISGFREDGDLQRLVFLLYRYIGIDMSGDIRGDITVNSCFFSRFYDPRQCGIMSEIDSGIVSGIAGGGRLVFTERLTEGACACRACIKKEETI